jgi:hypothetical protein
MANYFYVCFPDRKPPEEPRIVAGSTRQDVWSRFNYSFPHEKIEVIPISRDAELVLDMEKKKL